MDALVLSLTQDEAIGLLKHLRQEAMCHVCSEWVYELIQKLTVLLDDR